MREFEDVLLAVNDLELAARQPRADIAGVHPALAVEHLGRLLLRLEVALQSAPRVLASLKMCSEPRNTMENNNTYQGAHLEQNGKQQQLSKSTPGTQ